MIEAKQAWGIVLVWSKSWKHYDMSRSQVVKSESAAHNLVKKLSDKDFNNCLSPEFFEIEIKKFED